MKTDTSSMPVANVLLLSIMPPTKRTLSETTKLADPTRAPSTYRSVVLARPTSVTMCHMPSPTNGARLNPVNTYVPFKLKELRRNAPFMENSANPSLTINARTPEPINGFVNQTFTAHSVCSETPQQPS